MAKQKIHELAKELKIASKVIVDYMNKKTKDKKYTPSNALEAEEAADIKANLEHLSRADARLKESSAFAGEKEAAPKRQESRQPAGNAEKGAQPKNQDAKEKDASRPKKKASITAVLMRSTASRTAGRIRMAAVGESRGSGENAGRVL